MDPEQWKRLREIAEAHQQAQKNVPQVDNTYLPYPHYGGGLCPGCGRCQHCGRPSWPQWPHMTWTVNS